MQIDRLRENPELAVDSSYRKLYDAVGKGDKQLQAKAVAIVDYTDKNGKVKFMGGSSSKYGEGKWTGKPGESAGRHTPKLDEFLPEGITVHGKNIPVTYAIFALAGKLPPGPKRNEILWQINNGTNSSWGDLKGIKALEIPDIENVGNLYKETYGKEFPPGRKSLTKGEIKDLRGKQLSNYANAVQDIFEANIEKEFFDN